MSERLIKPRALTKKQISKLTDDALSAALTDNERDAVTAKTRATFDRTPPKKMATEGTGTYRERLRQSEAADAREYARVARANAEFELYNSKGQARQRMVDTMGANITAESRAKRAASEKERAARDRQHDLLSDLSAVPYGARPIVTWESEK